MELRAQYSRVNYATETKGTKVHTLTQQYSKFIKISDSLQFRKNPDRQLMTFV